MREGDSRAPAAIQRLWSGVGDLQRSDGSGQLRAKLVSVDLLGIGKG
jgi:hypothetical protein